MHVVGFSLVDNAVRLDFPVLQSLRSILELCNELVVNVGPSNDGTLELVQSLDDPRLRILRGAWDRAAGAGMLAVETQRVLDQVRGDWAIYIQADEVLHEAGLPALRSALAEAADDPRVEGLLVDFVHFYGGVDWVGSSRSWYRREVRVVRPGAGLSSVGDAQGFRAGTARRRVRARQSGAVYHHYGWARPIETLRHKREVDNLLYYGGAERRAPITDRLPSDVGLRRFRGAHPALMHDWIAARRDRMSPGFAPRRWDARRLALMASLGLERLTGWRPFEHRNYVEV